MPDGQKVTSIQPQKKRKDRFSVFLDGEFAFGLSNDVLLSSGIATGDTLSEEKIKEILDGENRVRAKQKAFRLLAVRAQSRDELRRRLFRDHYSDEIVAWVISELERLGLVDDRAFALMFARSRMITRPEGRFLLERELRQKGINDSDIEFAVDSVFEEYDEGAIAWELAAKRKPQVKHVDEQKAKLRVRDFLFRRGFPPELIHRILSQWDELDRNG